MFISFSIKLKVKRIHKNKRTIYNFSKANWDDLNNDLKKVDWDSGLGNCIDINNAWVMFKTILLALCDKHIKKLKVSSRGQPPWMDSDIHKISLKKTVIEQSLMKLVILHTMKKLKIAARI